MIHRERIPEIDDAAKSPDQLGWMLRRKRLDLERATADPPLRRHNRNMYKGRSCEVCREWDHAILEEHHLRPKYHVYGPEFDDCLDTVLFCANCHTKCHKLFGGGNTRRMPYGGPRTRDELIAAIRRERRRFKGMQPKHLRYDGKDAGVISQETRDAIIAEYDGGQTMISLGMKYRIHRRTIKKIIEKEYGKNGMATLNWKSVLRVRKLAAAGVPKEELAEKYKVTKRTIQRAINGDTWNQPIET